MNPDKFNAISPYLDDIAMTLEEMLMEDSDHAKQVRYSLMEISKALGSDFPSISTSSCRRSPTESSEHCRSSNRGCQPITVTPPTPTPLTARRIAMSSAAPFTSCPTTGARNAGNPG